MIFNSLDFAIFLPLVFCIYWMAGSTKLPLQNIVVLIASYIFYGFWNWKFLGLIFLSTVVDFLVGLRLAKDHRPAYRNLWLGMSIFFNLGMLGFFKYFNFFAESFAHAFTWFGASLSVSSLNIILPVGISFYTFQTMSYTIDVFRRQISPTRDFLAFSAYVSFFPQLVAGPIERATHLLPQFFEKRHFDEKNAICGLRQILWGYFKKIVIADNCAVYANIIFNDCGQYAGSTLWLGAFFFAMQIYADFSGYSDIAIGVSKMFGFTLMQNFAFPYFSRNIAEFWRRWHMSLTTWFRDYLYIPLGGSRGDMGCRVRNIFVIFVLSGLWHGANWTFIVWGCLNAVYFLPLLFCHANRKYLDTVAPNRIIPSIKDLSSMAGTFVLVLIAWVFFRAENLPHAWIYLKGMFSPSIFEMPVFPNRAGAVTTIIVVAVFMTLEWMGRNDQFAIENLGMKWPRWLRFSLYYVFLVCIFYFAGPVQQFIYFQF